VAAASRRFQINFLLWAEADLNPKRASVFNLAENLMALLAQLAWADSEEMVNSAWEEFLPVWEVSLRPQRDSTAPQLDSGFIPNDV
jgi:hypothetical protein